MRTNTASLNAQCALTLYMRYTFTVYRIYRPPAQASYRRAVLTTQSQGACVFWPRRAQGALTPEDGFGYVLLYGSRISELQKLFLRYNYMLY